MQRGEGGKGKVIQPSSHMGLLLTLPWVSYFKLCRSNLQYVSQAQTNIMGWTGCFILMAILSGGGGGRRGGEIEDG